MTDALRPCPNLACRSMNVEAAYLRTPGGSDPGCLDCSITCTHRDVDEGCRGGEGGDVVITIGGTCKDCANWRGDWQRRDSRCARTSLAILLDANEMAPEVRDDPDGRRREPHVFTGPDFGCIHWSKR